MPLHRIDRLMASPAVVGEDLLIRSEFALYRIGL